MAGGADVPLNLMERVMFLRSTALCSGLPDPALRTIAEVAHERAYDPGDVLCYENDLGTDMFLILDGRVEIRKAGQRPTDGARGDELGRLLVVLEHGECVGEMSVLDDQPRSASVVAQGSVSVFTIQKEDLRDAIALCPDLAFGLFRVLAGRLRSTQAPQPSPAPQPAC
jgi:CRP/FNR family cyclic AMP-dependent transcriptional regulator